MSAKKNDDIYYIDCTKKGVNKHKKNDKSICASCKQRIQKNDCPFCRSHKLICSRSEKRKKKIKKAALESKYAMRRQKRITLEKLGYRQELCEEEGRARVDTGYHVYYFHPINGKAPAFRFVENCMPGLTWMSGAHTESERQYTDRVAANLEGFFGYRLPYRAPLQQEDLTLLERMILYST